VQMIDPTIIETCDEEQALRCIHVGLLCTQADSSLRPSMSTVNLMLSSHSVTLPDPTKPAFVSSNVSQNSKSTSSGSGLCTLCCSHDNSRSRLCINKSRNYNSRVYFDCMCNRNYSSRVYFGCMRNLSIINKEFCNLSIINKELCKPLAMWLSILVLQAFGNVAFHTSSFFLFYLCICLCFHSHGIISMLIF
jgi:hypothetical protein